MSIEIIKRVRKWAGKFSPRPHYNRERESMLRADTADRLLREEVENLEQEIRDHDPLKRWHHSMKRDQER